MFKIGNIKVTKPAILAPMAGVTDHPFRLICKKLGAGIVYTEFVSAEGIIRKNEKTLDMIKFIDEERPIGIQIFGDNPETVGLSARYINDNFKPDLIDINFGCPVPKITKKGAGSAALKDLCLMEDIVSSVIENVSIPVTAKMRLGWDNSSIKSTNAGMLLEKLGVKAVALHARTTSQQYTGISDWNYIKELKDAISIPVIGNGDVKSYNDFKKMKEFTNCDAVMIGRAALGNPWIFKEIIDKKKRATKMHELKEMCIHHVDLLNKNKPAQVAVNLSKKHLSYYLKSFNGASEYRKKIMKCNDLEDIKSILKTI